jgi:hypothetical protein
MPELASEPTLQAVIVHELVHAADDERYDLTRLFAGCTSSDALRADNALIEGHAQLVARELAAGLGWSAGFETFTRAITAPPKRLADSGDTGGQLVQRTLSNAITASYTEGEAFLAALRAAGGEEAVRKAFLEPPGDMVLISRPEWFLHPELRPRVAFELDPALDAFAAGFEGKDWACNRGSVSAADMRVSMAPLTAEEIEPLAAKMRQNRVQSATQVQTGSQIVLGLFEFGTAEEAASYLTIYERLQHARDDTLKEGSVRILSSDYEALEAPDPRGLRVEKRILFNGLNIDVSALCVTRGPLAVEMLASNLSEWDTDRLLETALKSLDEVVRHPRTGGAEESRGR